MNQENPTSRFKIKTCLLLVLIYVISFHPKHEQLGWVWGILFLVWIIPSIRSGHTHLAEPISRSENPIWYWLIVVTWVGLSLYVAVEPLLRKMNWLG